MSNEMNLLIKVCGVVPVAINYITKSLPGLNVRWVEEDNIYSRIHIVIM